MSNTHSLDLEASSSQYASITDANQTGLDITGDLTIEAWVKLEQLPSTATSTMCLVGKYRDAGGTGGYKLVITTSDILRLNFVDNDGKTTQTLIDSDSAIVTSNDVGEWVHLAVSADISTPTGVIYKNGVAVASTVSSPTSTATTIATNTNDFAIGYDSNNSTQYVDGLIDEVRVWNDVRTAQEIQDNLGKELVGNEANLQGYWKLNNDYTDETSNGNDLTASGSPVFSTDVPFDNTTLLSQLVAYYKLDESSGNAADSWGSNTLTNTSVTYSAGKINNGSVFSGSSSYLTASAKVTPIGAKTVAFWMKTSDASTFQIMLANLGDGNTEYGFTTYTNNNIGFEVTQASGTKVCSLVTTGVTVDDGSWHHYVFTWDGTTDADKVIVYVDGVSNNTATANNTETVTPTANLRLGANPVTGGNEFTGSLDEVGIWSRALTSTEVTRLYNNDSGAQYPFLGLGVSFDISETLSLSETTSTLRTRLFSIAENLSLVEGVSALKGIAFSVADTLGLVEVYSYAQTWVFNVAESLGLVEHVKVKKPITNRTKNKATGISNRVKNIATNIKNRVKS